MWHRTRHFIEVIVEQLFEFWLLEAFLGAREARVSQGSNTTGRQLEWSDTEILSASSLVILNPSSPALF